MAGAYCILILLINYHSPLVDTFSVPTLASSLYFDVSYRGFPGRIIKNQILYHSEIGRTYFATYSAHGLRTQL